jgi:dihydroorotate dehydrogenase electron transfer subunit
LTDPGIAWLSRRLPGERINLIGPLGNGFPQPVPSQNTLLATDLRRLPIMQPLIQAALDRRGRVTLIVRAEDDLAPDALHKGLPIAVELRLARNLDELVGHLQETLVWADRLCTALPELDAAKLTDLIRRTRLRVEPDFAHVLVQADLLCGSGACLACVVPTSGGGLTRACVHGPVFDLTRLG